MQLAAFARRAPPDFDEDGFPCEQANSKEAGTQRHDSKAIRARITLHAPVAQWIEQPPPKGQVGRSIRLWGAKPCRFISFIADHFDFLAFGPREAQGKSIAPCLP